MRVCNEGVGEWQHAADSAQGGDGEASSPFLQRRTHPSASTSTATALPAATPLGQRRRRAGDDEDEGDMQRALQGWQLVLLFFVAR